MSRFIDGKPLPVSKPFARLRIEPVPSDAPAWIAAVPGLYEVPVYRFRAPASDSRLNTVRFVYILSDGPRTLYIGEAGNVLKRLAEHERDWPARGWAMFTRALVLPVRGTLSVRIEDALKRLASASGDGPRYAAHTPYLRPADRRVLAALGAV